MPDLKPATRLFVQFDGGYYPVPWDATTGLVILPGTGTGVLVQSGRSYSLTAAGFAPNLGADETSIRADLAAALLSPVMIAHPGDDLAALMAGKGGFIEMEPGQYAGFTVPERS